MRGLSTRNLSYMRDFARAYPNPEIVQQLAAKLPWFHIAGGSDGGRLGVAIPPRIA